MWFAFLSMWFAFFICGLLSLVCGLSSSICSFFAFLSGVCLPQSAVSSICDWPASVCSLLFLVLTFIVLYLYVHWLHQSVVYISLQFIFPQFQNSRHPPAPHRFHLLFTGWPTVFGREVWALEEGWPRPPCHGLTVSDKKGWRGGGEIFFRAKNFFCRWQ